MTVVWHDRLASTMDTAHALAEQGAPHGTAIAAREQEAGRGRRGRRWHSPRGGLWMSVICRPGDVSAMEHLSLRVGLAVADTLEQLLPGLPRLTVKWPNDLLIEGHKVAGILCEARWDGSRPGWVVVGVGVNVVNRVPEAVAESGASLREFVPVSGPESLAGPIAEAIARAASTGGRLSPAEESRLAGRDVGP